MDQRILSIAQISKEAGFPDDKIAGILLALPTGDMEEVTFLEAAGQWILEASNMIDDAFPTLTSKERTIKKFKLMGNLLILKAELLQSD